MGTTTHRPADETREPAIPAPTGLTQLEQFEQLLGCFSRQKGDEQCHADFVGRLLADAPFDPRPTRHHPFSRWSDAVPPGCFSWRHRSDDWYDAGDSDEIDGSYIVLEPAEAGEPRD